MLTDAQKLLKVYTNKLIVFLPYGNLNTIKNRGLIKYTYGMFLTFTFAVKLTQLKYLSQLKVNFILCHICNTWSFKLVSRFAPFSETNILYLKPTSWSFKITLSNVFWSKNWLNIVTIYIIDRNSIQWLYLLDSYIFLNPFTRMH